MASPEGLDSWSFRQSFNIDSWLNSDYFSHDSDLLTKALHKSISNTDSPFVSDLSPPQTLSNVSFGSDPELVVTQTKRKRSSVVGVSGKSTTKRRSRVSTKKSQTTFITADAANFRSMVQQVTGAKFINGSFAQIVKPEPQRVGSRLPPSCGSLDRSSSIVPTLDTSSFLSNHYQGSDSFHQSSIPVTANVVGGGGGGGGGSAVELSNYSSFPTLESWKVM